MPGRKVVGYGIRTDQSPSATSENRPCITLAAVLLDGVETPELYQTNVISSQSDFYNTQSGKIGSNVWK
jgi:hypothetical protein